MHCMVQQLWLHPDTLIMVMWTPIAFLKCPILCWVQNSSHIAGRVFMCVYVFICTYTSVYMYIFRYVLCICGLLSWLSSEESSCQCMRWGFNSWVRKLPWRRKCNPLQYSCMKNSMYRGSWRATVNGIARVRHDLVTKSPPLPYVYTHK